METYVIFLILGVLCAFWNVVISLMVYAALHKRGYPVSFIWLRLLAPKYAHQYKEITRAETGRVGSLFYLWVISINLALVFMIIAFFTGI